MVRDKAGSAAYARCSLKRRKGPRSFQRKRRRQVTCSQGMERATALGEVPGQQVTNWSWQCQFLFSELPVLSRLSHLLCQTRQTVSKTCSLRWPNRAWCSPHVPSVNEHLSHAPRCAQDCAPKATGLTLGGHRPLVFPERDLAAEELLLHGKVSESGSWMSRRRPCYNREGRAPSTSGSVVSLPRGSAPL